MITYDQVVGEIREIIADKGEDYIYPKVRCAGDGEGLICQYFDKGEPSCIIGHWLTKHDVRSTALEGDNAGAVVPLLVPEIAGKACTFLDYLQAKQDSGLTWGIALEDALRLTENRIES